MQWNNCVVCKKKIGQVTFEEQNGLCDNCTICPNCGKHETRKEKDGSDLCFQCREANTARAREIYQAKRDGNLAGDNLPIRNETDGQKS